MFQHFVVRIAISPNCSAPNCEGISDWFPFVPNLFQVAFWGILHFQTHYIWGWIFCCSPGYQITTHSRRGHICSPDAPDIGTSLFRRRWTARFSIPMEKKFRRPGQHLKIIYFSFPGFREFPTRNGQMVKCDLEVQNPSWFSKELETHACHFNPHHYLQKIKAQTKIPHGTSPIK